MNEHRRRYGSRLPLYREGEALDEEIDVRNFEWLTLECESLTLTGWVKRVGASWWLRDGQGDIPAERVLRVYENP